jgi:light-regulated signal transduction histidine kinase (bacteriophytochrome)
LREAVRELEVFSYSMVHDMRVPLRAMNSFARILCEGYSSRLDETGRGYLTRISNSAERLDQLIRDVLKYTHVLRDQAPLAPVDLEQLLRELHASYPAWSPPQAEVQIVGPIPIVLGHAALLAQCFSNLVGNAIRFVAPGVQPRVRLWAEPHEANVRINVQDNGIGIGAECHDRVFGMFQRLHAASEYEGTGIGLSIVRRAAERMGGRVGFDSEPGKGSTFWVDLPQPEGK